MSATSNRCERGHDEQLCVDRVGDTPGGKRLCVHTRFASCLVHLPAGAYPGLRSLTHESALAESLLEGCGHLRTMRTHSLRPGRYCPACASLVLPPVPPRLYRGGILHARFRGVTSHPENGQFVATRRCGSDSGLRRRKYVEHVLSPGTAPPRSETPRRMPSIQSAIALASRSARFSTAAAARCSAVA